jgi:outer membrane receptor for ferrienterochelin and colicins
MTIQSSKYKDAQTWSDNSALAPGKKMFRSPDAYGYITGYCSPLKNLGVALSGNYTGSMLVKHSAGYITEDTQKNTPDFFDLGIKVSYDIKINGITKMQINAGIKNIFNSYQKDFDKGEERDAEYIYGPSLPETVEFGIKVTI